VTETDDWRVAIIVDPALAPGLLANTVAVIGVGLGAAAPWLGQHALSDALGRTVFNSANRPVPVLQASAEGIGQLLIRALPAPQGAIVVPFPAYARALHDFAEYRSEFGVRDLACELTEGLGLAGPSKWVRSLTGALKLLR
jgi:hypothetical protein